MDENSIFYYPYATFQDAQLPLLKAAALYFDKLYILDPLQASFDGIGIQSDVDEDVDLLKDAGILERINPREILCHKEYRVALEEEILADLEDSEFRNLCESHTHKDYWTLALAKVPENLRTDERFKPIEDSMRRILSVYDKPYIEGRVFDEVRYSIEYRYVDLPLYIGESIMINHALITGLRYSKASPITDDPFHKMIFDYKVNRALKKVEIRDMLESVAYQKIKQSEIAKELLLDLDLAIISPKLPMEAILEYRNENEDKLKEARTELLWLARKIRENPYTKTFRDKIYHDIIPKDIY